MPLISGSYGTSVLQKMLAFKIDHRLDSVDILGRKCSQTTFEIATEPELSTDLIVEYEIKSFSTVRVVFVTSYNAAF